MSKIQIFIAGAKGLKEQRLLLKALANDLNDEYNKKGRDITIIMKSYENFGDRQEDYNHYIEHEADLVLFVLDGRIGKNTENEFKLAAKKLDKDKRPKIKVFLKSFEENTEDIKHIEILMNTLLDSYYIEYKNNEELVLKAKGRIRTFVRDKIKEERYNVIKKARNNRKMLVSSVSSVVVASLIMFLVFLNYFTTHYPRQIVQLAGGGSVINFVKDELKLDLRDDPSLLYSNMPTGSSWALLKEDLVTRKGDTQEQLRDNNRFFTVSLSASRINDADFINFYKKSSDKGALVEYHLTSDTLAVYANRELIEKLSFNKNVITPKELSEWIKDPKITCYVTNYTSGTRNEYMKGLKDSTLLPEHYENIYYDITKYDNLDTGLFCLLGSQYYTIKTWEAMKMTKLFFVDENGKNYKKDMYLYFNVFKTENEETNLIIPSAVIKFLKKINARGIENVTSAPFFYNIKEARDGVIINYDSIPMIKEAIAKGKSK